MPASTVPLGTAFSIEIDAQQYGIGLVTETSPPEYFIIVFDAISTDRLFPLWEQAVEHAKPVLAGLALDAKFYHGNWVTLGRVPDLYLKRFPHPLFSVLWNGKPVVEHVDETKATPGEIKRSAAKPVPRATRAGVGFENALRAIHGLTSWDAKFDRLRYEHYFRT